MDKQGWLKRVMEDAVLEVERRPTWMKPAGLRQQELEKRREASEVKTPNNGGEQSGGSE
jgi:hypothetical protein